MIRYRLAELLADRQFRDGKRTTMAELSEGTGVSRVTLSKMINVRGYNTSTDILNSLCGYFGCSIDKLIEYFPDEA